MRTVKKTLAELPEISATRQDELCMLTDNADHNVDLSDAPELTPAQLASMERGKFFRPIKKQVTARLDADVLHWLKSKGKGYQTRMNDILRTAMQKDQ